MLKLCGDCKQSLPPTAYNMNCRSADGLQSHCRGCQKAQGKIYRELNRDTLTAKISEWAKLNREKVNGYKRKNYAKNSVEIKAKVAIWASKNKASVNAKTKRWSDANPGSRAARQARRVAAKLHRTPRWLTKEDFAQMKGMYELAQKLTKDSGVMHHVDHILPMQGTLVSGLHVPSNLQILQGPENCSKRNTWNPE